MIDSMINPKCDTNLLLSQQCQQKLDHFQWMHSLLDQATSCEQDDCQHNSLKILLIHLYMKNPSNAIPSHSSPGVFEEVVPYIDYLLEPEIHLQVARVNYAPVNSQQHPVIQLR